MGPLILIRHGQSFWNAENRFTGWVNVDLTDKGREEARKAGLILRYSGLDFTHSEVFVSPLKRAKETCAIVLAYLGLSLEPRDDINFVERYYGALTGCRKEEVVKVYGRDQVQRWRRSYREAPPKLPRNPDDPDDPRNQPPFRDSPLYNIQTENLADVVNRVQSVYEAEIVPLRNAGKTVVLIAHGNTNRALIKLALDLSEQEIESVELPTGVPVIVTNREWALVSDLGLRRHQSLQKTPEYLAWAREFAGSQRG